MSVTLNETPPAASSGSAWANGAHGPHPLLATLKSADRGKVVSAREAVRLIRDSVVIYSGKIGSLRRFKDDVREVATGYECGIGIDGYNDIRIGDVIESYMLEESAATL